MIGMNETEKIEEPVPRSGSRSSGLLWTGLRVAALAGMGLVTALTWGRWSIPDVDAADPLMYTNLGNLAFWVVWIMGLVILVPLLGRAWCCVCPLGALNEWVARRGLGLSAPRWLRNDYLKALALLATVMLLGLARIHHYPGATALYLGGWLALAVTAGVLFHGRVLCGSICPIGAMLAFYGRVSPLHIRVRSAERCHDCEGRECIRGSVRWAALGLGRLRAAFRLTRHPCPVNLRVWDMRGTARCLFCLNCVRACPYDNVEAALRRPLVPLWSESYPRFSESAVAAALLGYLLLSYMKFWPWAEQVLAWPAAAAAGVVGASAARVLFLLWLGFGLPWLILLAPATAIRWGHALSPDAPVPVTNTDGSHGGSPLKLWLAPARSRNADEAEGEEAILDPVSSIQGMTALFLPALAPVLLAGHMVLALVKVNAKAAYLPLALADPAGVRSYMAVEELGLMPRPGLLIPLGATRAIAAGIMLLGLAASLYAVRRIAGRQGVPSLPHALQAGLVAAALGGGLAKWLF